MIKVLISLLFATALFAASQDYQPLPSNVCDENCDDGSSLVWEKYQSFDTGLIPEIAVGAYTGRCYKRKTTYPIFGTFVIRVRDGKYYFNGITTHHAFPNPYMNYTEEELFIDMETKIDYNHQVFDMGNESFTNMNPGGDVTVMYWLRQNPESGEIIYISLTAQGVTFCYLPKK